jgi:hypothetical protein
MIAWNTRMFRKCRAAPLHLVEASRRGHDVSEFKMATAFARTHLASIGKSQTPDLFLALLRLSLHIIIACISTVAFAYWSFPLALILPVDAVVAQ